MSSEKPQHETPKEEKPKPKFNPKVLISPVISGIKSIFLSIKDVPKMILKGDASQRFLVLGFLAGISLLVISTQQIMKRWSPPSAPKKHVMTVEEEMIARHEKKEALKRAEKSVVFLQKAITTILNSENQRVQFSIELYAECDSPKTANWIKDNIDQMKEVVVSAIQEQKFEELMKDEGKEDLKVNVKNALNKAFLKAHHNDKDAGKINSIYISHLELGD